MGKRRPSPSLVLLVTLTLFGASSAQASKYPGQLSLGVYEEELTTPTFYETFVPFLYEFAVPVYKALDITLRDWRGKCDTENVSPSYTCPVFYYFERLIERFEQEVVPKAWVASTSTGNSSSAKSASSAVRTVLDFCNSIQRHFTGSFTQQFSFEKYVEQLRTCPAGELKFMRGITDYVFNFKTIFKKMNDNYELEFSNKFFGETNKKTGPAFYVNAVTTHQNGLLLFYWVEKTRWSQAQLACNDQRIPEFLLKHQNLSTSIGQLTSKLNLQNQITSIPVDQVSAYYKLPLADCTFVENTGNFIVRVFIPVIRKDITPKLYRLRTVPFLYKDETKEEICQIRPIQRKFIHDKVSGIIQASECESDSLCQIKGQMDSSVDMCVRSVFANSTQGVRKHCQFDCTPLNETFGVLSLPLFSRVSTDTWIITGGPSSIGISIKCQGRKDEILEMQSYGALEVKLPCECNLMYRSEFFYVEYPCEMGVNSDPIVRQLTPVHFLNREALKDFEAGKSSNISLPINDNNILPESPQRLNGSAGSNDEVKVVANGGPQQGAQLGFLWALVILQLCLITFLVSLAAYKYSKYRRSMSYSKEPLVYNIYPSPSSNSINESRPVSSNVDNANIF